MNENKQTNKVNFKRIVARAFVTILFLLILITTLFTIACSVKASNLAFGKYRFYIMKSKSQPEVASEGSLVIAKGTKYGEINVGDKIVYKDNKFYFCDEVIKIKKADTISKIIVAEKEGVKYQFSEYEVSGKIVKSINKLGYFIDFMRTTKGIILFIAVMICLYIVLRVFLLYNKNNNDNNLEKNNIKSSDDNSNLKDIKKIL